MSRKVGFDSAHADAAAKLAQATKTLSTEARLWADQLTARASRATPEQRTQACLQHLAGLPDGVRRMAYVELCKREATQPAPLSLRLDD